MLHCKLKKMFVITVATAFLLAWSAAGALRVGIYQDGRSKAVDEILKTLEAEDGITAEVFEINRRSRVDYSKFQDYDVVFFGGGNAARDWLSVKGRMHLIELVEQRGGGVVFSMFRCGTTFRSNIRPLFPDVANGIRKVNSRGMILVDPDHPVTQGLPHEYLNSYFDHSVLRPGPEGKVLAVNTGGNATIACGPAGYGRVVFIGPWIGVNMQGGNMYPFSEIDRKLLVNSIRWAGASGNRDRSEVVELSETTQTKVLRREHTRDWTHNERGMSYLPGVLTQARNAVEQKLDVLSFRLERCSRAAAANKDTAERTLLTRNEMARLLAELNSNHRQAVRNKELEIAEMTLDELKYFEIADMPLAELAGLQERFRVNARNKRRDELVEEWSSRLLFPHQISAVEAKIQALEQELAPVLEKMNEEKFAAARAEDAGIAGRLAAELDSGTAAERAAAARELGRIGDTGRRTVRALINALADSEYQVRRNALYALSWLQSRDAVPDILEMLGTHEDARTRRRAAQALGQIGDVRAVDGLIAALGDDDYHVRQNAILALGWIGDSRAVGPLMDLVKESACDEHAGLLADGHRYHGNLYISEFGWDSVDLACAIRALGHIGSEEAVELLSQVSEKFSEESAHRFLPELRVEEAANLALASIEAGGRGVNGVVQLEEMKGKDHFYWMSGRYNALFGRYTSYRVEPKEADVMLIYAASSGGTGTIEFNTPDKMEARQPDIIPEEHLANASELGLKINFEMRHRGSRFDKAGMEYDLMRLADYPAFGGFWGEESLHFDETLRALPEITTQMFRDYLSRKYSAEALETLGIGPVDEVELPEPDNKGTRPSYLRTGARRNQQVLFAEYVEFVADDGVEQWEEAREWLNGFRKGAKMSFSLSARYVGGGSTYISGYPRVNLALDAAGPQCYTEHSSMNNFHLDMHVDGESRPAQGEFYAMQSDTPGRIERGFASSFLYGQQFFNWSWHHIFKHAGGACFMEGPDRWEAVVRQFSKGRALSRYLAPKDTKGAGLVTQLYSGRTVTLTYGFGRTDGFGGHHGMRTGKQGYPARYTQHQQSFWEALVRSHLPVEMTWLETQHPEKLAGYKVAVLSDAVSLNASEVEMLREWVRNGGTLVATASSTLHDQWDRRRENYALADVFGVDYVRTEQEYGFTFPGTDWITGFDYGREGDEPCLISVERDLKPAVGITEIRMTAPEYFLYMEGAVSAEYEKGTGYDVVEPATARVVGVWEDDTPAVFENSYGNGHAIFISARYPALSHQTKDWTVLDLYKEYWPGMRELLAACVRRGVELAGAEIPVEVENCPLTVDLALKRQEQNNRWMAHLLNMDEKNGLIREVKMTVKPPHPVKAVYYAYPEREEVEYFQTDDTIEFVVRPFNVHEMVVIEWE